MSALLPGTVSQTDVSQIQSESNIKLFKKLLKTYLFIFSFSFFYLFYRLSQHEMSAALFYRWTISLDKDDNDDENHIYSE